jgi:hypothetical protein
MDASRYFDAMHNAMSTLHAGAQLLLTIRLQDTCGNDAYLEVKQLPGEQSALVCYSTMGRRCLNFQLFRKGWQLCHNADGQLTGRDDQVSCLNALRIRADGRGGLFSRNDGFHKLSSPPHCDNSLSSSYLIVNIITVNRHVKKSKLCIPHNFGSHFSYVKKFFSY